MLFMLCYWLAGIPEQILLYWNQASIYHKHLFGFFTIWRSEGKASELQQIFVLPQYTGLIKYA